METLPPDEIAAQLALARALLERHLGRKLRTIHLFGSAVDGGLKPASDIDLLVTVDARLEEPLRHELMTALLSISAPPAENASLRALEVTVLAAPEVRPWRYPARRELQFGEWLREDLQAGRFEPAMHDNDLAILLTKAREHGIALLGPPAREFFDPVPPTDLSRALADTIAMWNHPSDWEGDELTVVLALARIWFTVSTGSIASKDAAADWALQHLPEAEQPVLQTARDTYLGTASDNLASRGDELARFIRHVKDAISAESRYIAHAAQPASASTAPWNAEKSVPDRMA
jgi:streptomycin 3"-adenylyltransferase